MHKAHSPNTTNSKNNLEAKVAVFGQHVVKKEHTNPSVQPSSTMPNSLEHRTSKPRKGVKTLAMLRAKHLSNRPYPEGQSPELTRENNLEWAI